MGHPQLTAYVAWTDPALSQLHDFPPHHVREGATIDKDATELVHSSLACRAFSHYESKSWEVAEDSRVVVTNSCICVSREEYNDMQWYWCTIESENSNIHYVHGRTLGSFHAHLKTCSDQVLAYTFTIHTQLAMTSLWLIAANSCYSRPYSLARTDTYAVLQGCTPMKTK